MSAQHSQIESPNIQAIAEARTMVSAFMGVTVGVFGVTRKNASGKVTGYEKVEAGRLLGRVSKLVSVSERHSLSIIVRPFYEWETVLTIVQADDLDAAVVEQVMPFVFCVTETSPASFQAFMCVLPGEDYMDDPSLIRRRVNAALGADPGASCAGRLAGTLNTKQVHLQPDGSYPRVRLVRVNAERVVNTAELRAAGLLVDVNPSTPTVIRTQRFGSQPRSRFTAGKRRRLPSYAKSLASVQLKEDGTPDRSAADLLFAVTCLRWQPPLTKDEIAALLMEHSEKARERKDDADWYVETTIDEAVRRA